jgi:DNA-binding NarL/FixJ family response regulator
MKPSEAKFALINDAPGSLDMVSFVVRRIGGTLVNSACNVAEAEDIVRSLDDSGVNVVLMDCDLGSDGGEGIGLTKRIQAEHPSVHVLSVSCAEALGKETGIPTLKHLGYNADELVAAIKPL